MRGMGESVSVPGSAGGMQGGKTPWHTVDEHADDLFYQTTVVIDPGHFFEAGEIDGSAVTLHFGNAQSSAPSISPARRFATGGR